MARLEDWKARLDTALVIAVEGGRIALDAFANLNRLKTFEKGHHNITTEADLAVEKFLSTQIGQQFPDDAIFGEEGGGSKRSLTWVIDPIDGTSNFISGVPLWCVSIAIIDQFGPVVGVVHDPNQNTSFWATRGCGAFCNGKPLACTAPISMQKARVGFGFAHKSSIGETSHTVEKLLNAGVELRLHGAGALMLAYVAAGRIDGFFEYYIHSWDCLAGLLLVSEAGGWTSSFPFHEDLGVGHSVAACNPFITEDLAHLTGIF